MNKQWFMVIGILGAAVLLVALDHRGGTKPRSEKAKPSLAVIGAAPFSGANPDDLKKQAEEQKKADIEAEAQAKAKAEEQAKQLEIQPKPATWPPEKPSTTNTPGSGTQPKNNAVPAVPARPSTPPTPTPGSTNPGTSQSQPTGNGTSTQTQDKQDFIRGY